MLNHFLPRAALVSAAFVASSALMLGVGALFDSVSRDPWLADGPLARAVLAECDARVAPAQRSACVRRLVAEARQAELRLAQLAPAR